MPDQKYRFDKGTTDSDRDGLSDDFERNVLGTNPNRRDSDGDGLNDYRELDFATNPMDDDHDNDGLKDGREVTIGTNPHSADTDGDKIDDRTEVRQNTAAAPDSNNDGTPDWSTLPGIRRVRMPTRSVTARRSGCAPIRSTSTPMPTSSRTTWRCSSGGIPGIRRSRGVHVDSRSRRCRAGRTGR